MSTHITAQNCRVCGCTDDDCRECIEAIGLPCWWVEEDLCSRCATKPLEPVFIRTGSAAMLPLAIGLALMGFIVTALAITCLVTGSSLREILSGLAGS